MFDTLHFLGSCWRQIPEHAEARLSGQQNHYQQEELPNKLQVIFFLYKVFKKSGMLWKVGWIQVRRF